MVLISPELGFYFMPVTRLYGYLVLCGVNPYPLDFFSCSGTPWNNVGYRQQKSKSNYH